MKVRGRALWVLVTLVVIVRLYLTGDRDILALNAPHDEFWYIQSAFNGIWGGRYDEMTLIHLPVYSVWLASLKFLGIPARLGIDVGWLLASGYLAYAIHRMARAVWPGLLLFIFLAFHPYINRIFDRALAETLLTVLSAAVLAAAIEIWNRSAEGRSAARNIALWIYGVGFALAYHTRTEGIVLLVPVLLLTCWSVYDWQIWWRTGDRLRLGLPLIVMPLLATLFLGGILAAANYAKWGVWATQELAAPGYKSAMAALSSIDTGPTPKRITVTREMLNLAYRESPTFRELQPAMEGAVGNQWVAIARPYVSIPGEIGNGWFYWALRDVAARTGWHANARLAERKYSAVAAELTEAFNVGRLKRRFGLSAFVDPDIEKWAGALPMSFNRVTMLLLRPATENIESPEESAGLLQKDRYIAVAGQRTAPLRTSVDGWITAPENSKVGIDGPGDKILWQSLEINRPDVPGAFGFSVTTASLRPADTLHVQTPDGHISHVTISTLQRGQVATVNLGNGIGPVQLGVDRIERDERTQRGANLEYRIAAWYIWMHYFLCAVIVCAAAVYVAKGDKSPEVIIFSLLIFAILARVGLLAVLDASSWSGTQARYIMPAISFFGCAGILGVVRLSRLNSNSWRSSDGL